LLKFAIPVLHVSNSAAAEEFYNRQLGFHRAFAYRPGAADPCYMGLTRDQVRLHLSSFSGDGVAGGVVYLGVDDVDALGGVPCEGRRDRYQAGGSDVGQPRDVRQGPRPQQPPLRPGAQRVMARSTGSVLPAAIQL
jgi:hypothetical protein